MAEDKSSKDGGKPEPSGARGTTPATAGGGETRVHSFTPENRQGSIDPSSPNDAITPPSVQAVEDDSDSNDPE